MESSNWWVSEEGDRCVGTVTSGGKERPHDDSVLSKRLAGSNYAVWKQTMFAVLPIQREWQLCANLSVRKEMRRHKEFPWSVPDLRSVSLFDAIYVGSLKPLKWITGAPANLGHIAWTYAPIIVSGINLLGCSRSLATLSEGSFDLIVLFGSALGASRRWAPRPESGSARTQIEQQVPGLQLFLFINCLWGFKGFTVYVYLWLTLSTVYEVSARVPLGVGGACRIWVCKYSFAVSWNLWHPHLPYVLLF